MSVLERIAAKAAGNNGNTEQPNAVVMMLLKQFGLTPEKIEEMVAPIITRVTSEVDRLHAENATMLNKLVEIENNMRVLLKDAEHDEFLEHLKTNCVVTQAQNLDDQPPIT